MSIRIDWDSIKQTIEASGYDAREPFLFVMPHAGRHLLLAIADRLEWEASFRGFDYSYDDWDELQAIVADTHKGLMEMEQVNLIVTALNEIRDAIQALTAEAADDDSTMETIADGIGLIDPRLGLLLEGVNAIEDLLGGSWEPSPNEEI